MATRKTQKNKKMLIDASHPEETRVVVIDDKGRIEEFDYESAQRKQLKGNIYLARVTRVEPSLQAAFVDYGGNRHGFLAFSEIHPDYYQIPVADREALLRDEAAAAKENGAQAEESTGEGEEAPESVAAEDALEELPPRPVNLRKRYRIQEVIKRGQVMLVQVVKEERGNKGAALTTYLSLAGRYCVLMPNTARGGGISRKITDARDRRRLKEIAEELKVPEGMGLIIRTAGAQRTRAEIRRDFNYLLRLWENIRELTLKSTAPKLVYEEGNLVKRAIRDLYTKDIAEILVEGEEAYREARAFMKMLMPSHVRNIKLYKESVPLFAQYNVDAQLDGLFSPVVPLPSGGYLVINQTEALVAIDINSGKSTREHSIEDTALKTNLEAAEEIARQLRLRDLAGLVVIDFIDMEDKRNIRAVERKLKEALKGDRARIQVGRISQFGLLEMSRQRLRQGMLENATRPCPHCFGTGVIRSVSSSALSVLRGIEEHLAAKGISEGSFTLRCNPDSAFYILNEKRDHLTGLERHYGVSIYVEPDRDIAPAAYEISAAQRAQKTQPAAQVKGAVRLETALQETPVEEEVPSAPEVAAEEQPKKKRRRRRGKRGGRKARKRAQARLEALQAQAGAAAEGSAAPFRVVDIGDMVIIVRNRPDAPASVLDAETWKLPSSRQSAGAEEDSQQDEAAASETTSQENDEGSAKKAQRKRNGRRGNGRRNGKGRRQRQKETADQPSGDMDASIPAEEAGTATQEPRSDTPQQAANSNDAAIPDAGKLEDVRSEAPAAGADDHEGDVSLTESVDTASSNDDDKPVLAARPPQDGDA